LKQVSSEEASEVPATLYRAAFVGIVGNRCKLTFAFLDRVMMGQGQMCRAFPSGIENRFQNPSED